MNDTPPSSRRRTILPPPPTPLTPIQKARVDEGMALVKAIAPRLARKYKGLVTEAELESAGYWGLLAAARTFDPDTGTAFATFASKHIHFTMLKEIKKESTERRRQRDLVRSLNDDDEAVTDAEDRRSPPLPDYSVEIVAGTANLVGTACRAERAGDSVVLTHEMRSAARVAEQAALEELSPSRRALFVLHYKEGRPLREVATTLGISYATVRRRIEELVDWFQKRLRALRGTPVPFSE